MVAWISMPVRNKQIRKNKNTMVTTATTTPHHNQAPHTLHHKYEVVYLAMERRNFSSTHSEQVTMTIMIKQKTILSNFEPNKPDPHPTKKT